MSPILDLDPADVVTLARDHYALEVLLLESFSGESATTSRITTEAGRFVFKAIAVHTDAEAEQVRWQGDVITQLHAAGLAVQQPHPSASGEITVVTTIHGTTIAVQILEWLEGSRVADVPMDAALLHDIGVTAARLATALDAVVPSPGPSGHPWDVRRSAEVLDATLPQLRDDKLVSLCSAARDLFLSVDLGPLSTGTVHQDLNDFNLLAAQDANGVSSVSGILDFGDLLEGVKIAELGVAAAYGMRRASDPIPALETVVRGWASIRGLTAEECEVLFPIAVTRLAVNAAVWSARLQGSRGEYGRDRLQGSAETVERCLAHDPREVLNRVRRAASLGPLV